MSIIVATDHGVKRKNAFSIPYLHKEAGHKCLPDVEVVVLAGELGARSTQVEPIHDARELLTDVVCRL